MRNIGLQRRVACIMLLLIENSRYYAGKWLYNNRLWFYSREFTTLQGYTKGLP